MGCQLLFLSALAVNVHAPRATRIASAKSLTEGVSLPHLRIYLLAKRQSSFWWV